MRRTSRHLLLITYHYVCVSGMVRKIRKAAAVRQRYNTLDFASKVVCQQGCYSPLLETQSRRDFRSGSPFCLPGGYPSKKKGWESHTRQRERWDYRNQAHPPFPEGSLPPCLKAPKMDLFIVLHRSILSHKTGFAFL